MTNTTATTTAGTTRMGPTRLFRAVAIAEAITWTLLLVGMFLKYVTETTELGVRIFGMAHGVVFVAYCVVTVVVGVDRRWTAKRFALALGAAVPPLATLPLEAQAIKRGWLSDTWRLPEGAGASLPDRVIAWLLRNPLRGAVIGVVVVAALTGLALLVGPPVGK